MDIKPEGFSEERRGIWRGVWQYVRAHSKALLPFSLGAVTVILAFLVYQALRTPPEQLTIKQVNTAVANAMASATPAPAYSARVYQAILPSLILIQAKGHDSAGDDENGLGSGVVVSAQGEILTAYHVVEGADEIQVTFADGFQTAAQVEAAQPENDIAVLVPERLPEMVVPAVMGNPNAMRVGDEAYAVGSPFGLYGSLSSGVISGFNRTFQAENSDQRIEGLIQVDTAVNPGNSGGPLVNRYGQVVGIVIGILNPTEDKVFIGIGFAVPIETAAGAAGAPQY